MWFNKGWDPKITKKSYHTISTFLIPAILSSLIEVLKHLHFYILNIEGKSGVILQDEFPWMYCASFITCIFLYLVFFCLVLLLNKWIKNKLFKFPSEEKHMKDTFLRLKEFGSKRQDCFKITSLSGTSGSTYAEFIINAHRESIDLVVSSCLEFFKDSFSEQRNLVNEITFEVSFMSKSFIDNEITIVSSDNNKHRTPPSMLNRNSNPNLYDDTETGKLYSRYKANPSATLAIHIVEDCSTEAEFTALYEGETDSIKSMAILPILSPRNELLGTLVVCVNQVNFFM